MKKIILLLGFSIFLLTACTNNQKINIYSHSDQDKNAINNTLQNFKEIYNGTAIFVEDELLVAIQVNPWIGFKEQKIEKKIEKKLKEQYPNTNVLVSTDFKLFWESNQLVEKENKEKIVKDIKKLKELAKEET